MINKNELKLLRGALEKLEAGFTDLPEFIPEFDETALADVLGEVAERMQDNYPYYHPQYAGQMLKPPHPVARIAYAMSAPLSSLWATPGWERLTRCRKFWRYAKSSISEFTQMPRTVAILDLPAT